MESFDMFLNGNFVAQSAFQERYGVSVGGGKVGHPDKMAECPLPIRSMWCIHRCLFVRACHQPSWLPLDDHFGPNPYERHDLHFLLCE